MPLSILYIGSDSGTSRHRRLALQRLGHRVSTVEPRNAVPLGSVFDSWIHHTGALLLGKMVQDFIMRQIGSSEFDVAIVNGGGLIDSRFIQRLRRQCGVIVNYNNDDPFGTRDGGKWRLYLQAVPEYDLIVVVRECNVDEAKRANAKDVLRVTMSADEIAHRPRTLGSEERLRWSSEVSFVGTWMPERGPFLARLIDLGVPLAIYGDRWTKAKEWRLLQRHWRGRGLNSDEEYAKALQCSRVCLGLLSKGNRDLSTTRSFEIPHLGAVLCAERTSEHLALYNEHEEACFWDSPEECAEKCLKLLAEEQLAQNLAERGRQRCLRNQSTNEAVLDRILYHALSMKRHPVGSASLTQ